MTNLQDRDSVDLRDGQRIEFNQPTWEAAATSVRNRYTNVTGPASFTMRSSSELPLRDVVSITVETLRRDLLNSEETMKILQAAVDSVRRRF